MIDRRAAPVKSNTILIVEDDAGVATLERNCLQRAGFAVVTAAGPEQALELLKQHDVVLIVLDYRLPGEVDGLTFYRRLKEAGHDLPVILVTGFSSEATLIQALRIGVRDFVTKSVEYLEYLPLAVERVLRQVRMERQLAESEARLASIIDSAKDAILVAEGDQRITLFNRAAEKMFAISAEQALGQPLARFIQRQHSVLESRSGNATDQPPESLTLRIRAGTVGVRADGREFPIETSVSRAQIGGRLMYTVLVRDTTERTQVEAARERLIAILEATTDLVAISQLEGPTSYLNAAGRRMLGLGPTEQILLSSARPRWATVSMLEEAIPTAIRDGVWSGETVLLSRDGQEIPVSQVLIAHKSASGQVEFLSTIARDIRDQKHLEEQLRQSQKMEAIGQLAGGVAHDFNNLLTIISGYSELLLENHAVQDSTRELVREIRNAGDRAASLTRQLLAFSRKQVLEPKVLDLNVLVADNEKMLRRLIGEDVELTTTLEPALARVKVDPGQMEQVILNLAVNARDAMPQGGKLTIETAMVALDSAFAQSHADMRPGHYVMLAVSDTGSGMDAATKARIFEPFFTTKGAGKGTGLGLATVFGIVKQSGGHIWLYSEPDLGTTFKVYLPVVDGRAIHDSALPGHANIPTGDETILLVEDEDVVRALARHALQLFGYCVLEARSGSEALRLSQEHAGPIHLVVSDVVMPGMSGREMMERLLESRPEIRVLYLSGYTNDAVVRHGVLQAEVAFLQKPFPPSALALKVREVLDQKTLPAPTTRDVS